jgi:hypothetical protein
MTNVEKQEVVRVAWSAVSVLPSGDIAAFAKALRELLKARARVAAVSAPVLEESGE